MKDIKTSLLEKANFIVKNHVADMRLNKDYVMPDRAELMRVKLNEEDDTVYFTFFSYDEFEDKFDNAKEIMKHLQKYGQSYETDDALYINLV